MTAGREAYSQDHFRDEQENKAASEGQVCLQFLSFIIPGFSARFSNLGVMIKFLYSHKNVLDFTDMY